MAIKLRLKSQSPTPAFSWDDVERQLESLHNTPDRDSLPSPPTSWLPAHDMKVFGARPLAQEVGIVRCNECSKPILASAMAEHSSNCEKARQNVVGKGGKAMAATGKKRKADEEGEEEAGGEPEPQKKKSKKAAAKPAKGRVKGPLNYDTQCGVINEKGQPCSRSISCKVHSMVLKRSVPNRSKPYDELLLDWKRVHIPGFVEPVKRETKAEKKEKRDREREEKKKAQEAAGLLPKGSKKSAGAKKPTKAAVAAAAAAAAATKEEEEQEAELDSDVELDFLIKSVRGGRTSVPLARPDNMTNFFVARNEKLRCCNDIVFTALKGSGFSAGGNAYGENAMIR
ncbi:hypothetical protein BOTBODRAFT_35701 [Botryobasidium botryosum FD-172 SS1]|uniref:SCA7 domain-containing protein n=1 Tax=Botryobasidium botryosum (strain FD-172 SS1) TaxID=930990 RepID=A0A067M8Y0_BOTB1|nr:hypothetical protein BOTBODRAFT_35701 [Botryobasidium botryosum FD-172 SS1]